MVTNKLVANGGANDALNLNGEFDIRHFRNGILVSEETVKNLVVRTGSEQVTKLLIGADNRPFTYIHIGTGTNEASLTDTALQAYYTDARAVVSAIVDETLGSSPAYRSVLTHTFTFAEEKAITEAGVFTGAHNTGEIMLSRQTFSERLVIPEDNLQITWRFTIG